MTMGNDMSSLYPDVITCMAIPVLEVKKMVYLFLINYAKGKPEMALEAISTFRRVNQFTVFFWAFYMFLSRTRLFLAVIVIY